VTLMVLPFLTQVMVFLAFLATGGGEAAGVFEGVGAGTTDEAEGVGVGATATTAAAVGNLLGS